MTKLGLITVLLLLAATAAVAQQGAESKPFPAEDNTPSSRQGAASFSRSTIQGCVTGSAVTGQYILTDENTGEIYVLQGNDALLKEQVGHEAVMTGTATPIRPSNQKGTLGYVSPNSSPARGTSSQGARALNFQVNLIQPIANQCRQQTESQKEAIAASQAALGSVQSQNQNATEPYIGYAAQSQTQNAFTGCISGSADDLLLTQEGEHRTYRLRGNRAGLKTEVETQAGRAQQPGRKTGLTAGGVPQPLNITAAQGAPPTAEQTAQNPAAAERIAVAAQRAELSNPQQQLGVNAQPVFEVTGVQDLAPTCGAAQR
jgi:hypothetical protein